MATLQVTPTMASTCHTSLFLWYTISDTRVEMARMTPAAVLNAATRTGNMVYTLRQFKSILVAWCHQVHDRLLLCYKISVILKLLISTDFEKLSSPQNHMERNENGLGKCSPGKLLTCATLVHHVNPSGVSKPCIVSTMLKCSTGELLARAAFMHHDDLGHDALRYHAILKGLRLDSPSVRRARLSSLMVR